MFAGLVNRGPFSSVKEFHDWFSRQAHRWQSNVKDFIDPVRPGLSDDSPIKFTHADLHPRNILISREGSPLICAFVDWRQSGWYPAYWEYCKAMYIVDEVGEWAADYVPRFLEPSDCLFVWGFYMNCLGC